MERTELEHVGYTHGRPGGYTARHRGLTKSIRNSAGPMCTGHPGASPELARSAVRLVQLTGLGWSNRFSSQRSKHVMGARHALQRRAGPTAGTRLSEARFC